MDALHETRRDYQPTRLSFYGVPPVGCSTRRPPQPGWCRATNCGRRPCASPAAGVRTDVAPTLALEKRGDVHGRTLSMERMCMTADRTRTNFGECAAAVRGLSSAARGGHSRERRGYRSTLRKGEQADRTARGEIVIVSSIGLLWNDVPGRLKEGGPPRTRRGTPSAAVGWGGCGWRTAALLRRPTPPRFAPHETQRRDMQSMGSKLTRISSRLVRLAPCWRLPTAVPQSTKALSHRSHLGWRLEKPRKMRA
jgi:hypothetical protein